MKALIHVNQSEWLVEGERFPGGDNPVEVNAELAPALAQAVHLGVVDLIDPSEELLAALEPHVESQEQAEENLAAAMGTWVERVWHPDGTQTPGFWDGPWTEGHLAQAAIDAESRGPNGEITISIDINDVGRITAEEVA